MFTGVTKEDTPAIVVVGVCASGKSSVVLGLRARGYRAKCVAQEHSGVPYLWQRSQPDFLVVLDANLETIKNRRFIAWGESRLILQRLRLVHAKRHCHLFIATDDLTVGQVVDQICQTVGVVYG